MSLSTKPTKQWMSPQIARLVLQERQKRDRIKQLLEAELLPEQKALIQDAAKFKAGVCSRRSGKTYASAYYLIQTAFSSPSELSLYIALTRMNAKNILWATLKSLNQKHGFAMEFKESELKVVFPNRAEIWLVGADTAQMAERLRGVRFKLIVIDEAASFRQHLQYLVDDVLTPTLIDANGTLLLIGTPSAACLGLFWEATTKPNTNYSIHSWNILCNHHIPHAKAWLQDYRKQKGWNEDHPTYLREWLGRWIKSEDSLVFKLRTSNLIAEVPKNLHYIFGIDLGYVDSNALTVCGFSYDQPGVFVVDEYKRSGQTISEFAEIIKQFKDLYNPISMVADTGGLGRAIVEELNVRFALGLKAAEKRDKFSIIELVNGDLIANRIYFLEPKTKHLRQEMEIMQWDEDHKSIDERSEDHLSDAFIYGFRESKHYTFEPKLPVAPDQEMIDYWERKSAELAQEEQEKEWL